MNQRRSCGGWAAWCASVPDQTSIIDEFPPHEWHGAGACLTWMNDYDADAKKNGITDGVVTLGKPLHVDVTGDRACVVVPVDYVFKMKGVTTRESASILTVALQKVAAGWRVTAWSCEALADSHPDSSAEREFCPRCLLRRV